MFQTNEDSGPAKGGLLGVLATFADKWGAREPLLSLPKGYQPRPRPAAGTWTAAQVAEHSTPGDAWLIIDNKVRNTYPRQPACAHGLPGTTAVPSCTACHPALNPLKHPSPVPGQTKQPQAPSPG